MIFQQSALGHVADGEREDQRSIDDAATQGCLDWELEPRIESVASIFGVERCPSERLRRGLGRHSALYSASLSQ